MRLTDRLFDGAGFSVEFTTAAWSLVRRFDAAPVEAGGVLLGRRLPESDDVVVDIVTGPEPQDQRGPARFVRDIEAHQALVDAAWRESEGRCVYLGEWHSHTAGGPVPSFRDWVTWASIARAHRDHRLVFVISTSQDAAVWGTAPGLPVRRMRQRSR